MVQIDLNLQWATQRSLPYFNETLHPAPPDNPPPPSSDLLMCLTAALIGVCHREREIVPAAIRFPSQFADVRVIVLSGAPRCECTPTARTAVHAIVDVGAVSRLVTFPASMVRAPLAVARMRTELLRLPLHGYELTTASALSHRTCTHTSPSIPSPSCVPLPWCTRCACLKVPCSGGILTSAPANRSAIERICILGKSRPQPGDR